MDQIVRVEIGTYVTRLMVSTRLAVVDLSARVTHSSLSAAQVRRKLHTQGVINSGFPNLPIF